MVYKVIMTGLISLILFGACDFLDFGGPEEQETPDTIAPADVTDIRCEASNQCLILSWTNPNDEDFTGVEITCEDATFAGAFIASGTSTYTVDGLTNGSEYTFCLVAEDEAGNGSPGVSISNIPFDTSTRIRIRGMFDISGTGTITAAVSTTLDVEDCSVVIVYDPELNDYNGFMTTLEAYPTFSFIDYEEVGIASDGSFAHEIDRGKSFVCFLVDKSQLFRKVQGIIGVGTADDTTWELMSSDILDGEVYFGDIPMSTVNTVLVTEVPAENLGLSSDDLAIVEQLAQFDDTVRFYENFINNSYTLFTMPAFWSPILVEPIGSALPSGEWLDGTDTYYDGYGLILCTTTLMGDVDLVPPAAVQSSGGTTYSPDNPAFFSIGEYGLWVQDYYAGILFWSDTDRLQPPTTSGYWQFVDSTQQVLAEMRIDASAFEETGHLRAPIPLVRVNENGDEGYVTDIDVKWVYYNGTAFEEMTAEVLDLIGFGPFELNAGDDTLQEIHVVAQTSGITNIQLDNPHLKDTDFGIGVQYMYNGCYFGFPY